MNTTNINIQQENNIQDLNEQHLLIKQFQQFNLKIYGTFEEPLFKAIDIGDLLGIKTIKKTIENLDNDCKIKLNAPNRGVGHYSNTWFLTEDGLYEVLFISRKPIAKEFKKWVRELIKEIRLNTNKELQDKLNEQNKQLEYFKELTYEQVNMDQILYIFSTDKDLVYKIGETKLNAKKRIQGLQTACIDEIKVIYVYKTCNAKLLETIVHYILDRYRCNSNREHFRVDINYAKMIINIVGKVINTCKSSFQNISEKELLEKIELNIPIEYNQIQEPIKIQEPVSKQKDLKISLQLNEISKQISKLKKSKKINYISDTPNPLIDIPDNLFEEDKPLIQEISSHNFSDELCLFSEN